MSNNSGSNSGGSLDLLACVTILIGGMIGSAIFSLSGLTIWYAGPAAILTWTIAAVVLLMYGMIVAELSAIFPKSGGVFVFPTKSLGHTERQGKIWGWISVWGYINGNIVAIAFAAIYVATFLGVGFPVFADYQIPLAVAACAFTCILNLFGMAVTGKANTVLVTGLVITMIVFVVVGLSGGQWDTALFTPFFAQGANGTSGFLTAVPNAMMAYGSVVAIAFMVGEVKNPNRNVPKSMIIAMSIVVTLYLLVIITVLGLQSAQYFDENPGMRFIPLYAVAFTKLAHVPWLSKAISISAVLALLTTMLVLIALTSRAVAATAEGGLLPKGLTKVTEKRRVPVYSIFVVTLGAMIVSCFPQFTATIVNMGSLFGAITICINCVSLVVARRKNPYIPGHFRAPGGPVLPVASIILIVACYIPGIISGASLWAYILIWYAVGAIILAIALSKMKKAEGAGIAAGSSVSPEQEGRQEKGAVTDAKHLVH